MIRQIMIYNPLVEDESNSLIAYDECVSMTLEEQLITRTKGFETLTIVFPLDNPVSKLFRPERRIRLGDDEFTIKKITQQKSSNKYITVECESLWYELNEGAPFERQWLSGTTEEVLEWLLTDTGWTVGTLETTKTHRFLVRSNSSPLYMVRFVARLVESEIYFDTVNKTVNMATQIGTESNQYVSYDRNLQGITRIDDTTQLCTRVYMYGADGVTIKDINSGIPYLEDYRYFDQEGIPRRIMSHVIEDNRFSLLESMRDHMLDYLATYGEPVVSYEIEQYILDGTLKIGDSLTILDPDLQKRATHRVIERTIDLLTPHKSTYVLDSAIGDLSSALTDDEDSVLDADFANAEDVTVINETLDEHIVDNVRHIVASERIAWNGAVTNVSRLQANVTTIQGQIASINSAIAGIDARLTAAEAELADHEARITALEGGTPTP